MRGGLGVLDYLVKGVNGPVQILWAAGVMVLLKEAVAQVVKEDRGTIDSYGLGL